MEYTINLTKEEIDIILIWADTTQSECDFDEECWTLYDKLYGLIENSTSQ